MAYVGIGFICFWVGFLFAGLVHSASLYSREGEDE